jgi:hypothetical protein
MILAPVGVFRRWIDGFTYCVTTSPTGDCADDRAHNSANRAAKSGSGSSPCNAATYCSHPSSNGMNFIATG